MKIRLKDEHRINVVTVGKMEQCYFNLLEKSVTNDTTRYFMQAMYYDYEGKVIASTDGRRMTLLHVDRLSIKDLLPNDNAWLEYSKGLLYVYDGSKETNGFFPDYRKIVQDDNELMTNGESYAIYKEKIRFGETSKMHINITRLLLDTKAALSVQYLLDLEGFEWQIKVNKDAQERKPVVFFAPNVEVIIMPFAYDENTEFKPINATEQIA